jgi:HAD superfamily hydrolase (TIGR01509 family)
VNDFPFRAVLFDMDGTLTDNARFHTLAWLEFFKTRFEYTLDENDHRVHGGKTKFIIESILERSFTDAEALEMHLQKEALYRELASGQIRPVAGLHEYLEWLRARDAKIALVTSADATNTAFVLRALGLEGVFETRVLGEDVRHGKPDPEPFALGAARVGVPVALCLAHEDSIAGVQSAARAGTTVCAVQTWLTPTALSEAGATHTVTDYAAWLEVLNAVTA